MHVNACLTVKPLARFLKCNGGKLKDITAFSSFLVCYNRNRTISACLFRFFDARENACFFAFRFAWQQVGSFVAELNL